MNQLVSYGKLDNMLTHAPHKKCRYNLLLIVGVDEYKTLSSDTIYLKVKDCCNKCGKSRRDEHRCDIVYTYKIDKTKENVDKYLGYEHKFCIFGQHIEIVSYKDTAQSKDNIYLFDAYVCDVCKKEHIGCTLHSVPRTEENIEKYNIDLYKITHNHTLDHVEYKYSDYSKKVYKLLHYKCTSAAENCEEYKDLDESDDFCDKCNSNTVTVFKKEDNTYDLDLTYMTKVIGHIEYKLICETCGNIKHSWKEDASERYYY